MSRQAQFINVRGNARDYQQIPDVMSNGSNIAHRNFAETVVHAEGDLTISVRLKNEAEAHNTENGRGEYMSSNNMLEESDSDSSADSGEPSDRPVCQPFSLLPPVTKEVITFMEAVLQYMKEVYKEGNENSKPSPTTGMIQVPDNFKSGGAEKVEVYPNSHCYISKSKMTAILQNADEDPENWIKLTRAILEEVYGKDLAYLSAKGTRGSQGIYVPLYNAIYALVNDRLRLLNRRVSEHEFNKRINKICSNKRGAAKRVAPVSLSSAKPAKVPKVEVPAATSVALEETLSRVPVQIPPELYPWVKHHKCERPECQHGCVCNEDDIFRDSVEMVPVDIELGGAEEVEIYPNSQCYISKSKMYGILLTADEDPDNWIKLTRSILEEVYGEDLANLSAKGTRGSQGISSQLYSALYALVNERLSTRNKYVSEHEFNKRINKICSNKRGSAKRAAKRSVTYTLGSAAGRSSKLDANEDSFLAV